MMSNSFKKYVLGIGVCCVTAASLPVLTACSDWNDHYEDQAVSPGSQLTLWQTMKQQPELSEFCEVLSQTKLLHQHKKTTVSYADLLDGVEAFTVMAPVNGTFNKDSLLQLVATDRGDSAVARSFVGNHLSFGLVSDVATPKDFFLLSSKRSTIGGGKVSGVPIVSGRSNVMAKGGILHELTAPLLYRYNLYEALTNNPVYSLLGSQLSSYEQDEFNPTQSVPGDMVDGEQLYADSVFDERNILLERVGRIADEDSTYMMVTAVNDEWERVFNEAMGYFRYDSTVEGADSLQRFWANRSLLSDAIFSRTIQNSPVDSVITYDYNRRYPMYHVFHRPFDEGGIFYGAKADEFSNGVLYTHERWPLTPEQTYFREIRTEGESTGLILTFDRCDYAPVVHAADSVSENAYLDITPKKSNDNWSVDFKLENTLAGTYDIYAILLPITVYDPKAVGKPCKFKAAVNYVDEKGTSQSFNCNNETFRSDPTRVDSILIAEDFTFPVCNYDQQNMKVSVKLTCNILQRESTTFSREMFLDCIYLRPKSNPQKEE